MLNARSLKGYAVHVSRARQLQKMISLQTESQIRNDTDVIDVLKQLSSFKIYFNSCGERRQNLAICLRENIIFLMHDTFPGILVIDITKRSFS